MGYIAYNILLLSAFVITLPLLPFILLLGPRYRSGFLQRLAIYPRAQANFSRVDQPIWIHAASVGEARSIERLVGALKDRVPQRKILVSTFTHTGNQIAKQLSGVDAVIFLPVDLPWVVERAMSRFEPSLLAIIETEIWPNLLRHAYRRGIPIVLLSGRLSERASSKYSLCRSFFRRALGFFTAFGMQSVEDAARIVRLGAEERKVSVVGSLKFAAPAPDRTNIALVARRPDKPLLVAGSTHRGEEESLLEALALARDQFADLTMIVAPRHPERFDDVANLIHNSRFNFHRKSRTAGADWFGTDILLLDSVGELVEFYAVADVAFVGGSLVEVGGHNILEPARLGKAILFGPHMSNFKNLAETMKQAGAAIEVSNAKELALAVVDLLTYPEKRRQMGRKAAAIAAANSDAFGLNLSLAQRYL